MAFSLNFPSSFWISSAIFYKWKSKCGGLEVSDARRLRRLEQENERLKSAR